VVTRLLPGEVRGLVLFVSIVASAHSLTAIDALLLLDFTATLMASSVWQQRIPNLLTSSPGFDSQQTQ